MICPNCGTEGDGVFCAVCGLKLPSRAEMDLNPAARRRAAEKAAEEAEAMRRRYEEASEAAKAMLKAVEDEETAAARVRAEREESLKRAVSEAEALLSDKTAKLTAVQAEQMAAERLLAERKAALAECQNAGRTPNIANTPSYKKSAWPPATFSYAQPDAPQPAVNPNKTQPAAQKQWADPSAQSGAQMPWFDTSAQSGAKTSWTDTSAQSGAKTPWPDTSAQSGPQTPWPDTPAQSGAKTSWPDTSAQSGPQMPWMDSSKQQGIKTSWTDASSLIDPIQPPEAKPWQAPNNSPWAAPPDPNPRWTPGVEPSQSEIWNTIVKNTPHDSDAENVLRKAAGYWKDTPPLPADRAADFRSQQTDPRMRQQTDMRNPQQESWGLGNTGSAPWQLNDQQRAKPVEINPQAAYIPRVSPNQREEKSRRPSKTNDSDFDEDNETDYDEDEEDDAGQKPSFFQGLFSGLKLGKSNKGKRQDDDDEDDDDEDYDEDDDDDYEDGGDDGDNGDDDEENTGGRSNMLKYILIGVGVIILIAGLSFGISRFLNGQFKDLIGGNKTANVTQEPDAPSQDTGAADAQIEAPVSVTELPQPHEGAPANPADFTIVTPPLLTAQKEERLIYCCQDPTGVFLLNNDYTASTRMTDIKAYNSVYEPPWIYFSSPDGIYRLNQDNYSVQPIINETYDTPPKFYVYNNYLYYARKGGPEGSWNIDRYDMSSQEGSYTAEYNKELIQNVNPNFYMDSYGVYTFADESVDHSDIPPYFAQPISPQQPDDGSRQRKNVFFSSLTEEKTYLFANLFMDNFETSRSDGVIAQVTESGTIREYMLAWSPENSGYASKEIFTGADGAIYELRFNERGSYALSRQADANSEKQTVADDIEPSAYYIYNNSVLYYLMLAYAEGENISYQMIKYDTGAQKTAPELVKDFGAYDQAIVDIAGKLQRNDVSFDKISIDDSGGDTIFFSGLIISADRWLSIKNRTNGDDPVALSPAL